MAFKSSHKLISLAPTHVETWIKEEPIATGHAALRSNLARPVYCVAGIPVDAVDLATVIRRIEAAASNRESLLVSTPNLNFLVSSLSDSEFRESLLDSDLCPPDGAPIIWIARLLGLPIKERAAGADLLDRLQARPPGARHLSVFLFGGAKGVAAAAAAKLNARSGNLNCVGAIYPGFCDVDEMSTDLIIDELNSSGADFLVLSLGAKKGQSWLRRNQHRLSIPIRSHLGAAVNYQAGIIRRAPPKIRAWGLEWLWRIKEERYLWKRYRDDGLVLTRLLLTRVLPLAVITRWQEVWNRYQEQDLRIKKAFDGQSIMITLSGAATKSNIAKATLWFQEALTDKKNTIIDLSGTRSIDARFFGLLLLVRKELRSQGAKLVFANVPRAIERMFRLNELGFLLGADPPN